jgi:hypothetical protein
VCQIGALAGEAPARTGRPIRQWSAREMADEITPRQSVPQISPRPAAWLLQKGRCRRIGGARGGPHNTRRTWTRKSRTSAWSPTTLPRWRSRASGWCARLHCRASKRWSASSPGALGRPARASAGSAHRVATGPARLSAVAMGRRAR